MRSRLLTVAPLFALLTACGGGAAADAPPRPMPAQAPVETEPQPVYEGPAADGPYQWPDGVTAEVIAVDAAPAIDAEVPTEDTEVRVTVEFGNTGGGVLSFGDAPNAVDSGPQTALLYGDNRTEAHAWYYENNKLPTRLTPGTTATWTALFTMPGDELGELAFTVSPDDMAHAPWTFTDVETLIG